MRQAMRRGGQRRHCRRHCGKKGWAERNKALQIVMLIIVFPERRVHKSVRKEKDLTNMLRSSYILRLIREAIVSVSLTLYKTFPSTIVAIPSLIGFIENR